ncbi:MAG: RNA polymerase sigma factor [Lautropia sp.]|nr:RNA polymerase sigma factor [Lautropia sp.]
MATRPEISEFLASVERRAFKQAVYAVRDEEAALDIVQDAMIRLVEKYEDRPAAELPPLFQRILQNIIHDHFRRQKVRNTWVSLFSALPLGRHDREQDQDTDPLDALLARQPDQQVPDTAQQVESEQLVRLIEAEIARLPRRQREAFVMRYWEEMDVAETAAVMGCSEGSVKTHCSRAIQSLSRALRAQGISL